MIDIDVRGIKEVKAFISALGSQGKKVITQELHKLAIDTRNDMIKSMRGTVKDGSKAYRMAGGKMHYASAEGYPPAIRSGNLINRIFIERGYNFSRVYTGNVEYAEYLEKGTSKMEARPFFKPAVDRSNWQKRIKNRIIAERFAGRRLEL